MSTPSPKHKVHDQSNLAASCGLAQLRALSSWTSPSFVTADWNDCDLQKEATVASVKRTAANEGLLVNRRPMTLSIDRLVTWHLYSSKHTNKALYPEVRYAHSRLEHPFLKSKHATYRALEDEALELHRHAAHLSSTSRKCINKRGTGAHKQPTYRQSQLRRPWCAALPV